MTVTGQSLTVQVAAVLRSSARDILAHFSRGQKCQLLRPDDLKRRPDHATNILRSLLHPPVKSGRDPQHAATACLGQRIGLFSFLHRHHGHYEKCLADLVELPQPALLARPLEWLPLGRPGPCLAPSSGPEQMPKHCFGWALASAFFKSMK